MVLKKNRFTCPRGATISERCLCRIWVRQINNRAERSFDSRSSIFHFQTLVRIKRRQVLERIFVGAPLGVFEVYRIDARQSSKRWFSSGSLITPSMESPVRSAY